MDSQQLKAFLAVARLQSFSQAADSLYLTQSAVSKRIQMLEQQLGTSLFDRHNRTITLTQAGQQLLPRAHQILNLMDDTEQDLANLSDQISGSLTFATSHHIGLHRLPPILQTYVRQYPAVQLNLEFRESERAYEMVRQRQVEFALTTLDDEADPLLSEILLWQDPMVCVCGIEHPLANRSSINLE
ncbi:MAG: LysR family transcriptional regulator, partial [Oceanobacter sp.]